MPKTKICAYVPILLPVSGSKSLRERFVEDLEVILQELEALSKILKIPFIDGKQVPAILEVLEEPDVHKKLLKLHISPLVRVRQVVYLKISCSVLMKPIPIPFSDGSVTHSVEAACDIFVYELEKRLYDLVIVANIARPGSMGVGEGVIIVEDRFYRQTEQTLSDLQSAVEYSEEIGWPKIERLQLSTVYDWMSSEDWLLDKVGGTPLIRAINAFSHIFGHGAEVGAGELFYSLIGIEALYAKGDGIAEQIYQKTQIFLGPIREFRKKLKAMYNFRSRLVHGQLDFPAKFDNQVAAEEVEREYFDALCLAEAILVATLQGLVRRGWKSLEFEYTLKEPL